MILRENVMKVLWILLLFEFQETIQQDNATTVKPVPVSNSNTTPAQVTVAESTTSNPVTTTSVLVTTKRVTSNTAPPSGTPSTQPNESSSTNKPTIVTSKTTLAPKTLPITKNPPILGDLTVYRACSNTNSHCNGHGTCYETLDTTIKFCRCLDDYYGRQCQHKINNVYEKVLFGLAIICGMILIITFVVTCQLHSKLCEMEDFKQKVVHERRMKKEIESRSPSPQPAKKYNKAKRDNGKKHQEIPRRQPDISTSHAKNTSTSKANGKEVSQPIKREKRGLQSNDNRFHRRDENRESTIIEEEVLNSQMQFLQNQLGYSDSDVASSVDSFAGSQMLLVESDNNKIGLRDSLKKAFAEGHHGSSLMVPKVTKLRNSKKEKKKKKTVRIQEDVKESSF